MSYIPTIVTPGNRRLALQKACNARDGRGDLGPRRWQRELVTSPSPEVTDRVTSEFEVWIGSAGPTSIFGIGLLHHPR
ncbi:MAG: hypothetical protein U0165_16420 [Polyangiaceae bacterium]